MPVAVDLAGGGARHHADGLPVDAEPEGVVFGGDSNNLARVDQADLDLRLAAREIAGARGAAEPSPAGGRSFVTKGVPHNWNPEHVILQGQTLMPQSPASAAELIRMQVAFALAAVPATFGTAAVCVLVGYHLASYWRLALVLAWACVPLSLFLRMQRCARRVRTAGTARR
jgi:hypothetical protein